MVQKMHHTITDGEGGVRMSEQFIDLERDPAPRPEPERVEQLDRRRPDAAAPGRERCSAPLADLVRGPLALARRAVGRRRRPWSPDPDRLAALPVDAVDTARSLARQSASPAAARSPLWTERSLRRRLEVLRVPLDDAKAGGQGLGGSVNDLFVTGAAGGAGAYHRRRGGRGRRAAHGDAGQHPLRQGAGRQRLHPDPAARPDEADPRIRFAAVRDLIGDHRRGARRRAGRRRSAAWAPPPDAGAGAPRPPAAATVDFTTSNVRGAPFELYIAGAKVLANHPIGPMAGTAFNLTTLSFAG